MLNDIKQDAALRMKKSIDSLRQELAKLRTGRAHPSILENILVEYYNSPTPLNQVSSIVITDPRTITLTPFEKHMSVVIDKAIRNAGLGLNPVVVGQVVRVPLPPLTEERRRDLTKQVKAEVENARIAIRNIRRDANNRLKSLLKEKQISIDDEHKGQDQIQKLTDQNIVDVDKMSQEKETDLMQI